MHALLKKSNINVYEKIVLRIMRENGLIIKMKETKKYNSYKGEITSAVENIFQRNFRPNKPNEKMLTDIKEFSIPAGKIYLLPIIDCFAGMVAVWSISISLNAELVNHILDKYHDTPNKEEPLIHSNRDAHYRLLRWIERMKKYGFTRNMPKKDSHVIMRFAKIFFGRRENEMFYGK